MSGDETGQLRRLLEGTVGQDPAFICPGCGGGRFVPCPGCGGSRKVFIEEEDLIHRCGECNENGLSSFGFVDYYDRRLAALAIMTLHGRHIYGQAIKVNWAYASTQREDTSGHFHIFVGDLSSEVNDATLYACSL